MPSSNSTSNVIRHIIHESPHTSRGRRGRQARPSQLSQNMLVAVRRFCRAVGAPNVVPPAGFRDFRGWLIRLNSKDSRPIWDELIGTLAKDASCDITSMQALTEDIVREIVKCVVIPRPDESAKLVSTNAGRQASRPRSGTTLMIVLEQQIARVEHRLPQLVSDLSRSRLTSSGRIEDTTALLNSSPNTYSTSMYNPSTSWSNRHRTTTSSFQRNPVKLPSIQDLLSGSQELTRPLPSFKELDASLYKRRTGHSHR